MIPTLYKRAKRGDDKTLATFDDVSVSSGSVYNNDGRPVYQIKFGPWSDDTNRYVFQLEQPDLESMIISLACYAGFETEVLGDKSRHPAYHHLIERLPIAARWLRTLANKADALYVEQKAAEAAKAKRRSEGFRT